MGKHALLSASSSSRWISCPPSARLGENYEDKGSDYAAEGTSAHLLCEYKLKKALGLDAKEPTADLTFYNEEMEKCADGYTEFILGLLEKAKESCKDPIILIEQRLDFSKYVKEGFGTVDALLIADGTIHVADYKHGAGILVESQDNPQMKLYSLGALELFDDIYDIDNVSMTVYQPRRDNVSTYIVSKENLYQWAEEIIKPAAELAYAGEGNYQCGEWCRFCKAKNECRARAEHNLELARYDFKLPPLLEDDEVDNILEKIDALVSWANDIKDYALRSALSGKHWSGWKLVEGKSNRKYINEDAVAKVVQAAGYDPFEHKVIGISAMEKKLGKSKFAELLGNLVEKPQGKPTLVLHSDKRPTINTVQQDFSEL
ncbi:Phage protein [Candidatus Syntrophocurvum alkaliphilum]|uniref:Phage protein n=1 Tax=Candidatus Syntrophocurvum alkaliphilum TaxID=2293317 RepID=A0A6I6DGK7_9FIRM|nr:DUF2800 domain-containing protein [Candidatus Syntrophocurvum alkaliphilum]QGT99530.1 Phage protein [Candidatus Syntrophocurvum alkaliphilum]